MKSGQVGGETENDPRARRGTRESGQGRAVSIVPCECHAALTHLIGRCSTSQSPKEQPIRHTEPRPEGRVGNTDELHPERERLERLGGDKVDHRGKLPSALCRRLYLPDRCGPTHGEPGLRIDRATHLLHGPLPDLILRQIMNVAQLERGMPGDLSSVCVRAGYVQGSGYACVERERTGHPLSALTSAMNFSLSTKAFSEPCISTLICRTLNDELARSCCQRELGFGDRSGCGES